MLKEILKLEGVTEVSKLAQKSIIASGTPLLACKCPDGSLVIGHGITCATVINQFCLLDS